MPDVPTSEVAAIEFYEGPMEAVGVLERLYRCGAVFIWTWRGPNPFRHVDPGESDCPLPTFRRHTCQARILSPHPPVSRSSSPRSMRLT